MIITDNIVEKIEVKADEHAVFIGRTMQDEVLQAVLLNKREAIELYQFLGEWIGGDR